MQERTPKSTDNIRPERVLESLLFTNPSLTRQILGAARSMRTFDLQAMAEETGIEFTLLSEYIKLHSIQDLQGLAKHLEDALRNAEKVKKRHSHIWGDFKS